MRLQLSEREETMPTLRTLAIAMAGAGMLASVSVTGARACDNDRYPCPIVPQAQEVAGAAAKSPAPSRKKPTHAARQDDKARAKTEQDAAQGASRAKATPSAGQEQAIISNPQKAADPARALSNEVDRNESPVAAAAAAWLVLPPGAGTGPQASSGDEAIPAAPANDVRVVDPNEVNELDLAAASAVPAQSSWLSYLLMTLGAALAAASTVRFLFV
jgi:hypothetical protein